MKREQLQKPLFYIQWIMIILSAVAIIFALIVEGWARTFDLSSDGFQAFLELFKPYSILFAATFIVITTYLGIEQLGLLKQSTFESLKTSKQVHWMQVVREFMTDIRENNPYMYKIVFSQLANIHDYLFENEYKIATKENTKDFFHKFFSTEVHNFEDQNSDYMIVAQYKSSEQSYTWCDFEPIIFAMDIRTENYKDFLKDLKKLYMKEVLEFSKDKIDPEAYSFGLKRLSDHRRDQANKNLAPQNSEIEL